MGSPNYQIRAGGKVFGPFTFDQLVALKSRGQLQSNHEIADDGQSWLPAASMPGLFDGDSFAQFGSPPWEVELRHSGFGIASFIIAIVAGMVMVAAFVYVGMMVVARNGGPIDEQSPEAALTGLAIIGSGLLLLLALGLGIAGALQRNRKKVFAVLGILLSGGILFCVAGIIVLGLAAQR